MIEEKKTKQQLIAENRSREQDWLMTKDQKAKALVEEVRHREHIETRDEIVKHRQRLDEFSVRDFAEGLFGEEFTEIVYGKDGGSMKMGDLKFSMQGGRGPGEVAMGLDQEQMIELMLESHPGLDRADALVMLTSQPEETKRLLSQTLDDQLQKVTAEAEENYRKMYGMDDSEGVAMTAYDPFRKPRGQG